MKGSPYRYARQCPFEALNAEKVGFRVHLGYTGRESDWDCVGNQTGPTGFSIASIAPTTRRTAAISLRLTADAER